jgi:hypothetical protein
VRIIPAVLTILLLLSPKVAGGQSFELHGSGGATVIDPGYNVAAGVGFSPISRLTLMVDIERIHIPSQFRTDDRGFTTAFRGGTLTLVAPGLRLSLLGPDRVGPYLVAGVVAGMSRPNVNDTFPTRVTNEVGGPFFGGGIQVPLGEQMALFADARLMLVVGKESDELFATAPIRAGLAWRF